MKRVHLTASLAAIGLLLLTACAARTSVGRILYDPAHYQNRDVHLQGRVTGAVDAFVAGGYQLDDGTGKIIVLSNGAPPRRGAEVALTGQVTPGASVLGHSVGVMVREHDRKVRHW